MGIRDILMFAAVFGAIPFVLRHPWVGVMLWVWIGVMNPHRLAFGYASTFPFALVAAAATLLGLLLTKDERRVRLTPELTFMVLFMAWMCITTVFAFNREEAPDLLLRTGKIFFMTFVGATLLHTKRHVYWLIAVICASLGFYAVKGGVFTILSGGGSRVYGPADSFIADNNALALAVTMVVPLLIFFYRDAKARWIRLGLLGSVILSSIAILGSHSRGALVAIVVMTGYLWLKSKNKLSLGVAILVVGPALVMFMPSNWEERMKTLSTYEEDGSAMGRIYAWQTAIRVANDRVVGGGFVMSIPEVFARYSPHPEIVLTAHSIYFQALGEHGWIGLALFSLTMFFAWRRAAYVIRHARADPELAWALSLAAMIQVSLVAFFAGGAFLSLTYWDVPYYLVLTVYVLGTIVRERQAARAGVPILGGRSVVANQH